MATKTTQPAQTNPLQDQLEKEVAELEAQLEAGKVKGAAVKVEAEEETTPSVPLPTPPSDAPSNTPYVAQIQDAVGQMTEDAKRIKAYLATEPKVIFHIPLGFGEKDGPHAVEYACINGYRFMMKKNVAIELPKSVYELVANHYNVQTADPAIANQFRSDRSNEHLSALG